LVDLSGLSEIGQYRTFTDVLKRYRDQIDRDVMEKGKVSDELSEDFRWLLGMRKVLDEILALSADAQKLLLKGE